MSAHESFEQLCALAVTGDLEPEEFRRLGEHLYECAECRAAYRDFHAIVEQGFPVLEPARSAGWSLPRLGMKTRFAKRAAKEGIRIEKSNAVNNAWRLPALATAALVIGLVVYGAYLYRSIQDREQDAASQIVSLTNTVRELEQRLSQTPSPAAAPSLVQTEPAPADREPQLENVLSLLRNDYDAAVASKSDLESRISTLAAELSGIREDSQSGRLETERLQRTLNETETLLTRANRELDTMRSVQAADAAVIAQQRSRLNELTAANREQAETIARERELLSVGKDIRDLMGARNLRIVDVQDDGMPGKVRPLAGRIFYTQGRSLIFYAYDLQNRGNVSRVDFQVWGKKEGRSQAPRSLGILYVDEPGQNRWVLKFENPEVLAQIDQVFVTVEPQGGSTQPTGKQLLTAAFLNESPNHP
jgi:hypothetical protein